jgi:hypothetical protein
VKTLSPCGTFISSTIMVMMMAITPSKNASSLDVPIIIALPHKNFCLTKIAIRASSRNIKRKMGNSSRKEYPARYTPISKQLAPAIRNWISEIG